MALSRWKCWFLSWTMLALRKCYNSSNEDRFPQKRCWIRTSRSNQWRYKAKSNISLHQLVLFHSEVMTIDHNDGYGGISNHISNTTQFMISSVTNSTSVHKVMHKSQHISINGNMFNLLHCNIGTAGRYQYCNVSLQRFHPLICTWWIYGAFSLLLNGKPL